MSAYREEKAAEAEASAKTWAGSAIGHFRRAMEWRHSANKKVGDARAEALRDARGQIQMCRYALDRWKSMKALARSWRREQ